MAVVVVKEAAALADGYDDDCCRNDADDGRRLLNDYGCYDYGGRGTRGDRHDGRCDCDFR